jgi:hypothetical protein
MSIISSATERAAWLASARLCWLQIEDLRSELTAALTPHSPPPATVLLAECDVHCERAQAELDRAIDRVKRLQP